jgi:hypothetical protein
MLWCLTSAAIVTALLALALLVVHPPRPRLPRIQPVRLLRGCAATVLLLVALTLGGLAILTSR